MPQCDGSGGCAWECQLSQVKSRLGQQRETEGKREVYNDWKEIHTCRFPAVYGHWREHTAGVKNLFRCFLSPNLREEGGNTSSSVLCFLKSVCESD